jgi:serine/threonine-protein kinase
LTAIEIPTPDPRSFDDASRPFAEAIAAQYSLKQMIGRGGMGVVYLARDRRLDRLVAIKTLPPNLAKDPAIRERFLRETRTAGAMSHPNIVPIHGADEIGQHVFFVMGFVDGDSLAARVGAQGRLGAREVAGALRDVASALAHAHDRGIIHRDIKAENILIDRGSGRAMVTDFGIARLADATPLTVTGQLLGTVYYVSPEQVSGGAIDARSDIYSLGVVGFLALAGRFPFDAEVASAVLVAHVTKTAPPLASVARDVPAVLASIIDRCLMKDPAHRFATAAELASVLEAAIAELDRPAAAKPPAPPSIISDTEAHAVWRRAAELQALTGVQPRPEAVARPRDEAKDRARRAGFGVDDVRAAASEAGIDEPYIEHALVEHGLRPGSRPSPAKLPADQPTPKKRAFWSGVRRVVSQETRVDGEIERRDVERLVNVLRDEVGTMGRTLASTRELAWTAGGAGSTLAVSVVPADGVTTIRVERTLRRRAVLLLVPLSLMAGVVSGLVVGGIIAAIVGGRAEPAFVLGGLAAGLYGAFKVGRLMLDGLRARASDRVKRISERIAAKVRESIG